MTGSPFESTITPVEEVPVTNHVASTYSQAIEYDPNEFREYVPGTSYFTKSNHVFTAPPQDFSLRIGDSRKLVFTGRFSYLTRGTLEYNNAFPNFTRSSAFERMPSEGAQYLRSLVIALIV